MRIPTFEARNQRGIRVLFRVHRLDVRVDLDELSSGEKSIIQMFSPLVERDIKALVREIDTGPQSADRPDSCVLIDEPELHLHPNLQLKVLDYLRVLTSQHRTQVIVATRSPTIVEGAAAAHRLARSVSSGRTSSRRRASLPAEGAVSARGGCSCALWNRAPGRPASESGSLCYGDGAHGPRRSPSKGAKVGFLSEWT
jgi:putative AbiEii toxin of type IV toxin-antitoxin system